MENKTWHRLCNEWSMNELNPYFEKMCKANGISYREPTASKASLMKEIRRQCQKNFIWLEDVCEESIYVTVMPFGGHTPESIRETKKAIAEYVSSGRKNSVYEAIIERYEG